MLPFSAADFDVTENWSCSAPILVRDGRNDQLGVRIEVEEEEKEEEEEEEKNVL